VHYAPRRIEDVREVAADLAIIAVKSYDTDGAIETLRRALPAGSDATLLTPQNGVGNEERLAGAFGADRIVAGALTVPLERRPDGAIVAANRGGLALAPVGGVAHNWLLAALGRTPIPLKVVSDYRALKWSKLALNVVANASCAILDILPARLVKLDGPFGLEIDAMRETRAVMAALDLRAVDLPRYPLRALQAVATLPRPLAERLLANRIAGARGHKPPSLLLDVRAGRGLTEVGVLNGAVAAAGARAGVATPVNAVFTQLTELVARDPSARERYRNDPAALLAAVAGVTLSEAR
jgi:2-dehydropantoate 2-reductase